jgi:prevent-host-death family protein
LRAGLEHAMVSGMSVTKISSREFNQDAGGAKKAADQGPVIITDRGRPAHVLLRFADYQRLLGRGPSLLDALAMPGGEDIDFNPQRLAGPVARPADLD